MSSLQITVIAVATLVAVGIVLWGVVSVRSEKDLIEERLGRYEEGGQTFLDLTEDDEPAEVTKRESALRNRIDTLVQDKPFAKKWRTQLARADIKLTVAEYASLHVISMFAFFAIGYFVLFGQSLVLGVVSGFVGFFAPRIYVSRTIQTRLVRFENQLPDTLGLWVNALRSGYSVFQSMEAIARDAPEPMATEFKRVVQEV
jgi:tight adherence protein B